MSAYTLYRGDSLKVLRTLPDNSVDSIVTDPPYGLSKSPDMADVLRHWLAGDDYKHAGSGFMGKSWDSFVPGPAVWREALRVLKPGGHLLAFFGSRTYDLGTLAIRLAGFEIRDQILWIYGSGFPKSLDVSKAIDKAAGAERETGPVDPARASRLVNQLDGSVSTGGEWKHGARRVTIDPPATDAARQWSGWGTALKPAHEPIVVARKPLDGTVSENVLRHGVGALNIDACRVATDENLNGGAYAKTGGRSESRALHAGSGMNQASKTTGREFEQPSGRWPANVIHDGSEPVLEAFAQFGERGASSPVKGTEPSNAVNNVYGERDRTPGVFHGDKGTAARFFYCAKASVAERNEGLEGMPERPSLKIDPTSAMARDGRRGDGVAANHHPTVKPVALMAYLINLVTPPGGVTLDMFMGSGTTGKAAMREGFQFIGIELDEDDDGRPLGYVDIAYRRIAHELARVQAERAAAPPPVRQLDMIDQLSGEAA